MRVMIAVIVAMVLGMAGSVSARDREGAIQAIEAEIRQADVEIAVCVDPASGAEVARFVGSAGAVRIGRICYGKIVIHNHPDGGPHMSLEDAQMAELYNAAELRTVGSQATCILSKPASRMYYGIGLVRNSGLWRLVSDRLREDGPAYAWPRLATLWRLNYRCETR